MENRALAGEGDRRRQWRGSRAGPGTPSTTGLRPAVPLPASGEDRFADSAAKFAGLAGALLGWRPDEFWRATPAELAAVLRAIVGDETPAACADDLARLTAMFPD